MTVDTLSVTSSDVQTCPEMSANFTAEALTNAPAERFYEWTEVGGSDSGTGDKFTTGSSPAATTATSSITV